MQSDIRNIRVLAKYGAFGRTDAIGIYIYGTRRDGRTVPCKSEVQPDGGIQIWSSYDDGSNELAFDMTEFSASEWARISGASGAEASRIANHIIGRRILAGS